MWPFGKLRRHHWAVFDCVAGTLARMERLPFEIGSGAQTDLRLNGAGVAERHCALTRLRRGKARLVKRPTDEPLAINGRLTDFCELAPETDYAVQLGGHFLLVRGCSDLEPWRLGLDHNAWTLYDSQARVLEGPLPLLDLLRAASRHRRAVDAIALPRGASTGFYLQQLMAVFARQAGVAEPEAKPADDPGGAAAPDAGWLSCPVCWLRFERAEMLHVAVHDSLRGDPALGPDAQLRFQATQFNARGQALDAFGLPCTETACPHCRRILPPGFADTPHHILSLVGDQSAGKSYYLSVLAKRLPAVFYRHFGVTFQDADPAANALLNDMKKALFGSDSPEQARLVKTQLDGAMYERLPRHGRTVALPRPFIFSVTPQRGPGAGCSIIFYDNAGEHFQPGRDSADSPGAQHIATASGLMFLFDPFNSPEFRRHLPDCPDPQVERPVVEQQDIILSEIKARITRHLGLPGGTRSRTPLAMIIGKCDAWQHLVPPFHNPLDNGNLRLDVVQENSDLARALMLELCPTIVANAATLSEQVLYFPVSSFGHPPVKVGAGDYVPDPRRINPILAEIPVLWLCSRIMPGLFPVSQA